MCSRSRKRMLQRLALPIRSEACRSIEAVRSDEALNALRTICRTLSTPF